MLFAEPCSHGSTQTFPQPLLASAWFPGEVLNATLRITHVSWQCGAREGPLCSEAAGLLLGPRARESTQARWTLK